MITRADCIELMDGHEPPNRGDSENTRAYFKILHTRLITAYGNVEELKFLLVQPSDCKEFKPLWDIRRGAQSDT